MAAARGSRSTRRAPSTATHHRTRRRHVLRDSLRPLRRQARLRLLHRYRLFRSVRWGESWMSAHRHGVPREWQNNHLLGGVRPGGEGPDVGRDERHARTCRVSACSSIPLHGEDAWRRGRLVRWRPILEAVSRGLPEMAATHILLDPRSDPSTRVLYATGFAAASSSRGTAARAWREKSPACPRMSRSRGACDGRNGVLYVVTVRLRRTAATAASRRAPLPPSRDGAENWERVALPPG